MYRVVTCVCLELKGSIYGCILGALQGFDVTGYKKVMSSRFRDPSLAGFDRPVKLRLCESHGCGQAGDFRAPKGRELADYYWFCLAHVREYNSKWDYFAGMSEAAIEQHIRGVSVWERPTWPLGDWKKQEQSLRDKAFRDFCGEGVSEEARPAPPTFVAGEREALLVLELAPPVDFVAIKAQYRAMVKKHHPDINNGSRDAEEMFKAINHAFTVLRGIYGGEEVGG